MATGYNKPGLRFETARTLPVILRNNAGTDCGFISLTYDNVGVFVDDANIFRGVCDKIHRNFKTANMVVKDGSE